MRPIATRTGEDAPPSSEPPVDRLGEIRRLSQRTAARRKFQFYAAEGREALAGERCQVSRGGGVTVHGVAEDEAYLLLHRTVMLSRAHSQARLHIVA